MSSDNFIWYDKSLTIEKLQGLSTQSMASYLGMEWVAVGTDFLQMRMPVDHRTHQPYGLLHGGASCALAETIGSMGSFLLVNSNQFACVGMEINANHIRSARNGWVIATAKPLHVGRSSHVWDIKIKDEEGALICVSRLTVAVVDREKAGLTVQSGS